MTTKLTKKLTYALETKNKLASALVNKGADINENTPFRAYPQIVEALPTQSPNQDVFTAYPFERGNKVIIQENQKDIPLQNGGFTGNLVGDFSTHVCSFACHYQDKFFLGFYNNIYYIYQFDNESKLIRPLYSHTTSVKPYYTFNNPIHQNLGSTYFISPESSDSLTALTYPSGGNFSNFEPSYCLFDSKGDYLIQYNSTSGLTDILKYQFDEELQTYSYTLIQSFSLTSQHVISAFATASGDINTSHTFALAGKIIFKINPKTDEVTQFNILDYNFPLSNPDILLFGQNYLILADTSTVYFIKADPIDESLALNEEGFYDNPSNYTYSIIHEESAPYLPRYNLCWHPSNIYSPRLAHLNFYIYVNKARIDTIDDFNFEFGNEEKKLILGIYFDENTFISHATRSSSSSSNTACMCQLYQRETPSVPFTPITPHFPYGCISLNENGFGLFNYNSNHFMFKLKQNEITGNALSGIAFRGLLNVFMKNALFFGYASGKTISYGHYHNSGSNTLSLRESVTAIIDEDFITDTYLCTAYYVNDKGKPIQLTCSDITPYLTSAFIFKHKGEYLFFNFGKSLGTNLSGTWQKVTFDIENKSFLLGETHLATANLTVQPSDVLLNIKQKELWLNKTNLFGVKEQEDTLHFMQIDFPEELILAFNGETPKHVQTYYDGSCGFLFSNGKTLVAHLEWDGASSTAHLKENTSIQTITPAIELADDFYTYLSPYKIYKSIYNSKNSIIHCTYVDPDKTEPHLLKLVPHTQENWDETNVIGFISTNEKINEDGYKMHNVSLSFN